MAWKCFLIEDTGLEERHIGVSERVEGAPCPLKDSYNGEHYARVVLGRYRREDETDRGFLADDDPRWPKACACGHVFGERGRSSGAAGIWRHPGTGEEFTINHAPNGAMWHAYWLANVEGHRVGADGYCLMVQLPGGPWCIDGPAYRPEGTTPGPAWERTGTAPDVTARPSILTPRYHGWLDSGVLSDDLEGRTYG